MSDPTVEDESEAQDEDSSPPCENTEEQSAEHSESSPVPVTPEPASPKRATLDSNTQQESTPAAPAPAPDKVLSPKSHREAIRARLREKEARLTNLVRNTSNDGAGSFLTQMQKVKENLEQVEKEKTELEDALAKLKMDTDEDEFLKEKMMGIQEGFDKQVKKIQSLENEVLSKNSEIDSLRDELVSKLRRIVELEFDLETHDVHYTSYAAEQFKLGEEALAEIKGKEKDLDESFSSVTTTESSPHGKKLTPRRAQKLISKLLADLDNLEARYKEEKLLSSARMEEIHLENEDLRTRIEVLEKRAREEDGKVNEGDSDDGMSEMERNNVMYMCKRTETLEAKKTLYRREMERLQAEIVETKKEAEEDARTARLDLDRLRLENEALQARITSLETKRRRNKHDNKEEFAGVNKRIEDMYNQITKMEATADIKERQIATLKKEVTNLRMKEIAQGNTEGRNYSKVDADLLRASPSRMQRNVAADDGEGGGADSAYVQALQVQLQDAQQQLVKKDQELVIERAKAASTAAGLLARITELTGKKADKNSKQVPLRFYL